MSVLKRMLSAVTLIFVFVLGSVPVAKADTTLINTNDTWLYQNDGTLPASNWYSAAYADGGWSAGAAPMGYEDPVSTTLSYGPDSTNKWTTYYFRKHFTVSSPGSVTGLLAQCLADDGAVVYLNGTRVYMTPNLRDPIANNTLTLQNHEAYNQPSQDFTINPSTLVAGDNVLAVEVHQGTLGSSDLWFDMALTAVSYATTNQMGGYPENWTAYNDTAWMDGDSVATLFTTNSPVTMSGNLLTDAGQPLQVNQVVFGTNSLVGLAMNGYTVTNPLSGAAATEFAGMIGTNNFVIWNSGTLSMTLTGLNTTKQYKVVILSTRGEVSSDPDNFYTNRLTDVVISSVDSFINTSSEGNNSSKFTSSVTDDSIHMQSDVTLGHVARFDQVRPGTDGTIILSLTPNTSLGENRAYLNAFKVVESSVSMGGGGDADVDGMDDAWETTYFGSTSAMNGGTNEDYDSDGSSNYDEYMAGTLPNSPSSKLAFTSTVTNAPGTVVFSWAGVVGKTYTVQGATTVTSTWTTVQTGIPGVSPTTVYTGSTASARSFMRVKVE